MKRRTLLIGLLAFSIFLAGCTQLQNQNNDDEDQDQGVEITQNDGLTIEFSSVTREYYDGDSYTFTANYQNTGEHSATLESSQVFGPSWISSTDYTPGVTLDPVEEANQFQGGTDSNQFTGSISTSLGAGQSDTYEVGLRTEYNYGASSRASLTVMEEDEYREDSTTRRQVETEVNAGPVHISFDVRTPIPAGRTVNIPVRVSNVGDGEIADTGSNDNELTLTVDQESGGTLANCDGNTATVYEGSRTFNCEFDTSGILSGAPQSDVTLVAEADFNYVEDDRAQVSVIGAN